jgi:hypothetical protein
VLEANHLRLAIPPNVIEHGPQAWLDIRDWISRCCRQKSAEAFGRGGGLGWGDETLSKTKTTPITSYKVEGARSDVGRGREKGRVDM